MTKLGVLGQAWAVGTLGQEFVRSGVFQESVTATEPRKLQKVPAPPQVGGGAWAGETRTRGRGGRAPGLTAELAAQVPARCRCFAIVFFKTGLMEEK